MFLLLLQRWIIISIILHPSIPSILAWRNSEYPDIRGPSVKNCSVTVKPGRLTYVCDPDHMLKSYEATRLNERLHILATNTSCPCQRRTQCSADDGPGSGFIVAVALAADLDLKRGPSENDLIERAEKFCRSLEGRWALGDCGNSLIIVAWKHYSKMLICPAQLAKRYVTKEEERRILANVNSLIQSNRWFDALLRVIDEVQHELEGAPKGRTDIGTISLLVSVIVAFVLCLIIACCVCAFRCFGNLKSDESDRVRKAVKRVDSLRAEVMRRGSQLRRSFSRSPKFPLVKDGNVVGNQFFPEADTTVV